MRSRRVRALISALVLALNALSIAACSSSGSSKPESSGSAGSTSSAAASSGGPTGALSTTASYTGPDSQFPETYPTPVMTSVKCIIGYLNFSNSIDAFRVEQNSAAAEAKRLGCQFIPKDAQANLDKQVSQFAELLTQGVTAIVAYPLDPSALGPSIAQAKVKGVPVIGQDSPPDSTQPALAGYTSTVLFGRDVAPFLLAQAVAAKYPHAQVATLGTALPIASTKYQMTRFKYWAQQFGLDFKGEVDAQTSDPSAIATAMSTILTRYPDVQVVFCHNDPCATEAAAQARSTGHAKVQTTGLSGTPDAYADIKSGSMFGTYRTDLEGIATQAVDGAYDAINKITIPARIVRPGKLVTAANVDQVPPVKVGS